MVKDPHPQATKMYRQILDILEELALLSTDATEEEEVDDSEAQVDTDIVDAMVEYRTQIKEKDLEQLAATKALGLKYLLSFDRDFEPFEEYTTPHEFIRLLKLKTAPTEF